MTEHSTRWITLMAALVAVALPAGASAAAQAMETGPAAGSTAPTPEALAELVLDRLVGGTPEAYAEVVPFEATLKSQAAAWEVPIAVDSAVVLRRWGADRSADADRALLLLGAWPVIGNRGDETVVGRTFSGLYVARRDADGWRLAEALPPDAGNRILAHRIAAELDPAYGLVVVDTLTVAGEGRYGFGAHLNRSAEIEAVTVAGRPAAHAFAGGYLWIDAPAADSMELVLAYRLPVATDTLGGTNSGRFGPGFGHVRSQYFWHPFYDFGSEADRARFHLTVTAPASARVVTSLLQTDTVVGDRRVVRAAGGPTFAATLAYDTGYTPLTARLGAMTVELFFTGDTDPTADSILASVRRTHRLLEERFGAPRARYLALAQLRQRGGRGWPFRSNALIAASEQPGRIGRGGPYPRAWLGHEVSHGWTAPTGPAANFLSEGWANFAESILIADRYGARAEADYWESQRTYYERHGFDGRARLSHDPNNSGVSYNKGAWVLRMLRDRVGDDAFRRGFAAYTALPAGQPAGLDAFVHAMEAASGQDVRPFLRPWVEEAVIPDLRARVDGGRAIVEQHQAPLFDLDVELALVVDFGAADTVRRTLRVHGRADTLEASGLGPVSGVRIDPDHRLLIRRHRGDRVRLVIAAPDADSVALGATFLDGRRPAARTEDGHWTVELELTAGVYGYWWWVDGGYVEPDGGERLVVDPIREITEEALP